ncbi:hypothetical protein V2S66_14245 [Streptomyces sp. V4-01]|uniref:Transposase n=1 Tax=Actinacidiphila polyblastidii TaxID=3110430 RepID=A0ABU7PCT4_9ACTN|nr:hypothetical protein [Streptomyces sp. V4-01]
MNITVKVSTDDAGAARTARFGHLPERVRIEDTVGEKQVAASDAVRRTYDAETSWNHFNCLAVDLGL